MDFYAAHAFTVEPLPRHSMLPYPYPEGKDYPADAEHLGISTGVQHAGAVGANAAELALSIFGAALKRRGYRSQRTSTQARS